jgi:hypothetical protein
VTENNRALVAAVVGAVAGGLASYMLFTKRGRALRRQLDPAIEDFAREIAQLRGTVNRAFRAGSEGWHVLNEAIGERGSGSHATPKQTHPF